MNDGLMNSVAALGTAEKRLEAIAANLANLHANGFKRANVTTTNFDTVLDGRLERRLASRRVTDFSQGPLRPTGETLDMALNGSGFFAVEGRDGEHYTRDGRFVSDDRGVLQTLDGHPVAWDGPRGTIDPAGEAVTIDREGYVRQGQSQVGKLRLVDFAQPARLRMYSGGLYTAPLDLVPQPADAEVRQGYLEQANVSAIDELVAMIAVQRQFEAGTRLMTSIDQSYRRLSTPR